MKGKKGSNILYENLVYFLVVAVFFGILFAFVARAGTGVSGYEKVYAKKLALIIDMAKPGSLVTLDVSDMALIALKENFDIVNIVKFSSGEIKVQLSANGGYSQRFFTKTRIISRGIEKQGNNYILKIEVNNE